MSGSSKKKSGSKKGGSTKGGTHSNIASDSNSGNGNGNGNESNNESNPLVRPTTNHTINPRSILTGFYQKNGKRVQHTVHDGALQMPKDALDVIETAAKLPAGALQPTPDYNLPGLDSVVRPCLDPKLEIIVVTELMMEKVQIPQEQPVATVATVAATSDSTTDAPGAATFQPVGPAVVKMIKTSRPAARNRKIHRILSSAPKQQPGTAAERIRGGGDVPTIEDQSQKQEPGALFKNLAAIAAVEPSVPAPTIQTPGVHSASVSDQNAFLATNDFAMAPEPPLPEGHDELKPETIHRDETSAMDTTVGPEVATIPKTVESTINNSKNIPISSEVGNAIDNISGASSTIQPPDPDVKTVTDFSTTPKNIASDSKFQREVSILDSKGTQDVSSSDIPAPGSSIPSSVNTTKSPFGLASKESGAEMEIASASNKEESQPQQQYASLETSKVPTAVASTNALSVDKSVTVTESSAQIEGNGVTAEKSVLLNSSQTKSAPTVQTQLDLLSSDTVVKTSEASTQPTASVASVAALSTGPACSSIVNTAIVNTVNSTAENSKDSSVLKNISSIMSSGVTTARNDASQTTGAIPVVTSSTSDVRPAITQVKEEETKPEEVPEAKQLQSKSSPQWEQHKPGPNDETITPENQLPPKPEWYKKDSISEIERTMLPEWFDRSSSHRTPETYIKTREKVIEMSESLSNRNVTSAMIRRSILGDAGSLQRLRIFLVNWGIINRDGINDSAPTTASLRPDLKRSATFTDDMRNNLILAVTEQASKKRKLALSSSSTTSLSLDWKEIACQVGDGVSAEDCRENFITTPLKEAPSNAMDVTEDNFSRSSSVSLEGKKSNQSQGKSQEYFIQNLVENSNPEVIKKVFDAAIEATDCNSVETQSASLLGLHLTQALENARGHEIDLALRLSKLLDTRMQKLENRMAMLDDVEGIIEAEKVALEMERRDLYTARCRHWFGGV